MILVNLTESERNHCVEYQKVVLDRVSKSPNYTGLHEPDRFFVGRVGEVALRKWAKLRCLVFSETVNDQGFADEQDFIFKMKNGTDRTVNVKNSLHPRAQYLMQPASQAEKHPNQQVFIGCSGIDDGKTITVTMWGAITSNDFMDRSTERMVKIPTLTYPLTDMPISMPAFAGFCQQQPVDREWIDAYEKGVW